MVEDTFHLRVRLFCCWDDSQCLYWGTYCLLFILSVLIYHHQEWYFSFSFHKIHDVHTLNYINIILFFIASRSLWINEGLHFACSMWITWNSSPKSWISCRCFYLLPYNTNQDGLEMVNLFSFIYLKQCHFIFWSVWILDINWFHYFVYETQKKFFYDLHCWILED